MRNRVSGSREITGSVQPSGRYTTGPHVRVLGRLNVLLGNWRRKKPAYRRPSQYGANKSQAGASTSKYPGDASSRPLHQTSPPGSRILPTRPIRLVQKFPKDLSSVSSLALPSGPVRNGLSFQQPSPLPRLPEINPRLRPYDRGPPACSSSAETRHQRVAGSIAEPPLEQTNRLSSLLTWQHESGPGYFLRRKAVPLTLPHSELW